MTAPRQETVVEFILNSERNLELAHKICSLDQNDGSFEFDVISKVCQKDSYKEMKDRVTESFEDAKLELFEKFIHAIEKRYLNSLNREFIAENDSRRIWHLPKNSVHPKFRIRLALPENKMSAISIGIQFESSISQDSIKMLTAKYKYSGTPTTSFACRIDINELKYGSLDFLRNIYRCWKNPSKTHPVAETLLDQIHELENLDVTTT